MVAPGQMLTARAIWAGYLAMILGNFMAILDIQIVASSLREIQAGVSASVGTIWTFLDRAGLTFKKRRPTRPSRSGRTS